MSNNDSAATAALRASRACLTEEVTVADDPVIQFSRIERDGGGEPRLVPRESPGQGPESATPLFREETCTWAALLTRLDELAAAHPDVVENPEWMLRKLAVFMASLFELSRGPLGQVDRPMYSEFTATGFGGWHGGKEPSAPHTLATRAAAHDLYEILALSAEGRKALANLGY